MGMWVPEALFSLCSFIHQLDGWTFESRLCVVLFSPKTGAELHAVGA